MIGVIGVIGSHSTEEMKNLTDKRSARDLHTIFNRVLVCTHPSLAPGNKDKLRVCLPDYLACIDVTW